MICVVLDDILVHCDNLPILLDFVEQPAPDLATLAQCFIISYNHQNISSPGDSHIESSWVFHEPNLVSLVRSDAIENDDVFFFTLETVNRVNFSYFVIIETSVFSEFTQKLMNL